MALADVLMTEKSGFLSLTEMWKRLKRFVGGNSTREPAAAMPISKGIEEPDGAVESRGYGAWTCAFCGKFASLETEQSSLCESRTCECGAIALAALFLFPLLL